MAKATAKAKSTDPDCQMTSAVLDLGLLNASSARVASFHARVAQAKIINWTYQDRTGKEKQGSRFFCLLVGKNSGSYCEAGMRGPEKKLDEAVKKFKNGDMFLLSKIRLNAKAKPDYIDSDIKLEVDLDGTKATPVLQGQVDLPMHATPKATCAQILKVHGKRRFDIMAIVRSVSEPKERTTPSGRKMVTDITLVDGSDHVDGLKCELGLSVWNPPTSPKPFELALHKPVLIHSLLATQKGDKITVASCDQTVVLTKDHCPSLSKNARFAMLEADAAALNSLPQEALQTVTATFTGDGENSWPFNIRDDAATLSCCHLLESIAESGGIGQDTPSLIQINDLRMEAPSGKVVTDDGDRIYFQTVFRDWTGGTTAGVTEATALEVTGCDDKAQFEAAAQEGTLQIPFLLNMRFVRTVRADNSVSLLAVTGAEASTTLAPSQSAQELLPLLRMCPSSTDGLVPAPLSCVTPCAFNGMHVNIAGQGRACKAVLALVQSTQKSTLVTLGGGYQVITKDITDCVVPPGTDLGGAGTTTPPEASTGTTKHVLTAFCDMDDVMDFKLDPIKQGREKKPRLAYVIVSGMGEDHFVVDALQLVEVEQEAAAKRRFEMLLSLAFSMPTNDDTGTKRKMTWDPEQTTPLDLKKCRNLQKWPTDAA